MAFAIERLRALQRAHGRDAVGIYVGNPAVHSHRASFAAQLLTLALRSHNRFDPNSQDSNPRLFAGMQMYGDALALPVPDIDRVDYLLVLGANPAVSNGSMMGLGDVRARLQAVRARGGQLVLVDPRRSESARYATAHHFIRPGGDAALLLSMLHVLAAEGLIAAAAVDARARGRSALEALAVRFPPERVAPAIGLEPDVIRGLARALARTDRACVYGRVGLCQGEFGPLATYLIEALNVVTNHFDREGCVLFPAPAADVAPLGRALVGNRSNRFRSRVRGLPEFLGALPSAVMAEEMETPGPGQIRALVCFAGNPVATTPNGPRLARAIRKLEFVLAVDFYLNETTRLADLVLPPRHVFESGNFDLILSRFAVRNVAKYSPPILGTDDDTRDDWDIATELAAGLALPRALGRAPAFRAWLRRGAHVVPERIIDALLRVGPMRTSLAALEAAPHGLDAGPLAPSHGRAVRTPDGKVNLAPEPLVRDVPRLLRWLDAARPALVLIGRRDLRSNNSWMHNLPALAKGPDRARLVMHPDDGAARGLADGARVRIESRTGAVTATLALSREIMPGVVSLPHGFGHGDAAATLRLASALPGPSANALTDELAVEPVLGCSILNGLAVTVAEAP